MVLQLAAPTASPAQPLQVRMNLGSALVSEIPILLQAFVHHVFEIDRQVGLAVMRQPGCGAESRLSRHPRYRLERATPGGHLYNTMPNENKSVRASRSSPRTCSGDIYEVVPTVAPGPVNKSSSVTVGSCDAGTAASVGTTFANPKSIIFACSRSVIKLLAGLMSR